MGSHAAMLVRTEIIATVSAMIEVNPTHAGRTLRHHAQLMALTPAMKARIVAARGISSPTAISVPPVNTLARWNAATVFIKRPRFDVDGFDTPILLSELRVRPS